MSDEPLPLPDEDGPPADPFDADLVAYLDGELDPVAARKIEVRLATDPAAREKAAALKKTFDLLDYLPRTEPSQTFTTRTLDKIPAMKSGTTPVQTQTQSAGPPISTPASMSSSVPVALTTGALSLSPVIPARPWLWATGILFAVIVFAAAGYFGAAALRPQQTATLPARDPASDAPSLSDRRLIGNLPLYSAADDFEFVQKLADLDYFGDEPSVSFDATPKVPAVEPDAPSDAVFEAFTKAFKALPSTRQQEIRELDKQLNEQKPSVRDRLVRVLEAYAVWLDRLPEPERKGVLAAATPGLRLAVIRDVRERQWLDSLPVAQRNQLNGLSVADRASRIGEWKKAEAERREEWGNVRLHADAIAANLAPWPFDNEQMKKNVVDYMRVTFKIDEPKKCRLVANEFTRYTNALANAEKNGGWAWYDYGRESFNLARKYEGFLLPEPAENRQLCMDFSDLPQSVNKMLGDPRLRRKLAPYVGKWPDFPLEVHDELRALPGKFGPGPPLGPAKASDFKEPVKTFWEKELSPKLSGQEKGMLRMFENRWPEYPREFVRLARIHDLSVPGVTLPGSPRKWSETYGGGGRPGRP